MRVVYLFVGLFLGCFGPVFGQEKPTFEAFADAREVPLESYVEVTFTLRNADGQNFQPPSFRDFVVVAGPSRSMSTTIINGQVSQELGFTFSLKPRRVGQFTIGPASIVADGKTLRTQPLSIRVVKGAPAAAGKGESSFFIRAEPTVTEAYVGQQIGLDYKLYTTIDIESYNVLEESDYPGFYAEDLKRYDSRLTREMVGGVQYVTKILKRVALFPQQAGVLTIDPLQLQLGVIEDGQNSGSLFFNRQIKRLFAETEPVSITVRPLPADAPDSFTGAVGQFSMTSVVNPLTLTTDDVVSLRLTIRGNGDIKRVLPPAIHFPDTFDIYEPKVVQESTFELNGELVGEKTIEYLALPKIAGTYVLQPVYSYFSPDSVKFVTLDESRYTIEVRQGSHSPKAPPVGQLTAPSEEDIRYIKLDIPRLSTGRSPFFGSALYWSLAGLPFLLLGGLAGVRRRQRRRGAIAPSELRRRQARRVARERLRAADQFRQQGQNRAFFDEVSRAMLGYVGDKLQIPLSEMSKDNVRERLLRLQVPEEEITRFLAVMHTCEVALFAGRADAEAMDATYQQASDVLAGLEQVV